MKSIAQEVLEIVDSVNEKKSDLEKYFGISYDDDWAEELSKRNILYTITLSSSDADEDYYKLLIESGKVSGGKFTIIDDEVIVFTGIDGLKSGKFVLDKPSNIKFKKVEPLGETPDNSVAHLVDESPEIEDFIEFGGELKDGDIVEWYNDDSMVVFFK